MEAFTLGIAGLIVILALIVGAAALYLAYDSVRS